MSDLFFIFSAHFDRDNGLDWGRLSLNSLSTGTRNIWTATSSTQGKQEVEGFHQKGGMIPPQYRVPKLGKWEVVVKPIPMPNVVGVSGNFYKINPHLITTDKGGVRGDFGIHLDSNSPGSLGCIVMKKEQFADFERVMKTLTVEKIPLFVQYS